MLAPWRITLRQAEEAIRSERFEEALELIGRAEVADHRKAHKLKDRIVDRLLRRATTECKQGNTEQAWCDLRLAEGIGAPATATGPVRNRLAKEDLLQIRKLLFAGNPEQAADRSQLLTKNGVHGEEQIQLQEGSRNWADGRKAARRGESKPGAELLAKAKKILGANSILDGELASAKSQEKSVAGLRDKLHSLVGKKDWTKVLHTAEALLDLAPDSREARYAKEEAWKKLGVKMSVANSLPETIYNEPKNPRVKPDAAAAAASERFILWIDGVGGFLVCSGKSVTIGQATPGATVDIPILGDISRFHATIARDGEGYLFQCRRDATVNGTPTHQQPLQHDDLIQLGRSVQLKVVMPSPVSMSARLDLVSPHRLHLALSGIMLMADTIVLGSTDQAHIPIPDYPGKVVIYRQGETLWCKADDSVEIDGIHQGSRGPLRNGSQVTVGDLSFSLEPLGRMLNQV